MQPDRHKSKEDTWKSEELKKHLKVMQSESGDDRRHKERRHHREEERDERAQHRHKPDEKIDDREHPKNLERDRHADRERGDNREHRTEKEKSRGDKDRPHVSETPRAKDREEERVRGGEKDREKEKARGGANDREQEKARGGDRDREKETARGGAKDREQEKARGGDRDREKETARGGAKDREQEKARGGDRDREKETARGGAKDREQEKARRGAKEREQEKARRGAKDREQEKARGGAKDKEKETARGGDKNREKETTRGGDKDKEKETVRGGDEDSEKETARGGEKDREKTRNSEERLLKEQGTYDLSKGERKMRDSLEKSKHRSEDRERRHLEKREKEGRKREGEEHEDRKLRHHKETEEFNNEDPDQERRRSERKHREASDREKRHLSRRESGTYPDQRSNEESEKQKRHQSRRESGTHPDQRSNEESERQKRHQNRRESGTHPDQRSNEESERQIRHQKRRESETHPDQRANEGPEREKEKLSREGDKEQRHRDKRDRRTRAHERKETVSQEKTSVHKSRSKEAVAKQESNDEKDIEEALYNSDTANDESTNYEEDFNDYDDDFEDESEKTEASNKAAEPKARSAEVEEIQKAMLLENRRISVGPALPRHKASAHQEQESSSEGRNSTPRNSAQRGVFIDFGSARQREVSGQISDNQKKRSLEILRLIDLDFSSTFSLLDLPPVKEYEMYIRNFGKTNTKQAYVQCNEDAVDREIQTEEMDLEEKWTQHPGEGAVVCGGHRSDAVQDADVVTKVDSQRLTTFLRSACQVISVLLEENRAETRSNYTAQSEEPGLSISERCFHLTTNLPFLQGRSVYQLQFSEAQRHLLLTVHGLGRTDSSSVRDKYILCVWDIWQPSAPHKILISESEVTCCCLSPGKASLVFAGTVDGSLLVWDLREDLRMHLSMMIEDTGWTFRSSTFSTDGVFAEVSHTRPVRAVEPVPSTEAKDGRISSLSSPEEMSGLSFQVASLDESGHLILWVVVELRKVDLAGSQSDLGLIPGGKVKLIHSSSIHLSDKFYRRDVLTLGSPQTMNIAFLPPDFNHFLIGSDIGLVSHGTRYGLAEPPLQYTSLHSKLRPAQVTAIHFSPFGVAAFLAGCLDGSIRLHTMSSEFPALQWNDSTNGRSVTALQWSLTRPAVFFVLDAASSIYIWDLSQNDLHPIAKESITSDSVLCMSIFGEPEKKNNIMALALGKTSGKVEIQYIKKEMAGIQPQELEKFHLMLQEIL